MSDRIPGSSWSNPIIYRDWLIYLNDYVGPGDHLCAFVFTHKDYDGPEDNRHGHAATVEACKREIDCIEDEWADDAGHVTERMAERDAEIAQNRWDAAHGR